MSIKYEGLSHPFEPIWNQSSRLLILGTFPSVQSRKSAFYYGHPQNRFWKVIAAVYDESVPATIWEKKDLLLRNGVALWDILSQCDITGSGDASIRNAVPNDIRGLIVRTKITRIYCNGRTAGALYRRWEEMDCAISAHVMPSTSPANAAWSLDQLIERWQALHETGG